MTALRFTIALAGSQALPPVELGADVIRIGSAPDAELRLPAAQVRPEHARIEGGRRLVAVEPVTLDGRELAGGATANLAPPCRLVVGSVAIDIAPATGAATPPARTASLAREVVRAMVAAAAGAPELVIEAGPATGARCVLDPPPSRVVVGRGEDADWIVLDPDLSRAHLAIDRTWDGVVVTDLESKNGTKVAGAVVPAGGAPLDDGATIEAGATRIRYRDPAARYLAELARPPTLAAPPAPEPAVTLTPVPAPAAAPDHGNPAAFWIALTVAALALAGMVWILA